MKYLLLFSLAFFVFNQNYSDCQESEIPKVSLSAYAKLKNGQNRPVVEIEIQEFLTTKIYALLNYVFFEENSSEIPAKYLRFRDFNQTKQFNPETQFLNWEILDVYYHILNIIGYRMTKIDTATISLLGCNSNKGPEFNNFEISRNRAESIKSYLVDIWRINPSRIKILEPRCLPLSPSISKEQPLKTDEENRRVELIGSWELLKPLIVNDTQRVASPPLIIFTPNIESKSQIKNWRLTIQQKLKDIRPPFYSDIPPPKEIIWVIKRENGELPIPEVPITYKMVVNADYQGQSKIGKIPVKEINILTKKKLKLKSKEYSRYNLILFDYSKSDLSNFNQQIVNLIKDKEPINELSKFYISGYTDIIGNLDVNLKLSKERAESIAQLLIKKGISPNQIITRGMGSTTSPYYKSAIDELIVNQGEYMDPYLYAEKELSNLVKTIDYNSTPEGRFYCRTVVIEIENNIEY